ncbi:MAG: S-layer homology domain-containing protein [Candidatus Baltobacteraceae bacterium]
MLKKAALSLVVIALLLTGCSKGDQSNNTATASPAETISPAENASPAGSSSPATSASAAPASSSSPQAVSYTDLTGVFGQKEITQLAALGVFGDATGAFNAGKPVSRREFVRWLFKANNSIWASDTNKLVHPAQGEDSNFKDIKTADADFQYIQGLQDSGVSVGFPDKTFKPDQTITREQALAIKDALDRGGVDADYVISKKDATFGYYSLPDWKDKQTISPEYVGAIATGYHDDKSSGSDPTRRVDNIPRAFGAIAMLKPKTALTRGQAAIMLWKIGPHSRAAQDQNARTAADALVPGAEPSASP